MGVGENGYGEKGGLESHFCQIIFCGIFKMEFSKIAECCGSVASFGYMAQDMMGNGPKGLVHG